MIVKFESMLIRRLKVVLDSLNTLFKVTYNCITGIEPEEGEGVSTFSRNSDANYGSLCDVSGRYRYDFSVSASEYVSIPEVTLSGDFTIDLTVSDIRSANGYVITGGQADGALQIEVSQSNGTLSLNLYVNGTIELSHQDSPTATGTHLVGVKRVSGELLLVFNGVDSDTTFPFTDDGVVNEIGRGSLVAPFPFAGKISDVSISSSTLDLFYPIDDGWDSNPVIRDTLGNGSTDGTAIGFDKTSWVNEQTGKIRPALVDQEAIEKKGILLEGEATNLLLHSHDLQNSPWQILNGTGGSVTENIEEGPDGRLRVDLVTLGSGGTTLVQVPSIPSTTTLTFSCWLSSDEPADYEMWVYNDASNNVREVVSVTSTPKRFSLSAVWGMALSGGEVALATLGDGTYGDTNRPSGSLKVWQTDLTTLPFMTSAILTDASEGTREPTSLTYPLTDNFLPENFHIETTFTLFGVASVEQTIFSFGNTGLTEYVTLRVDESGYFEATLVSGTTDVVTSTTILNPFTQYKVKVVYDEVNLELYINGILEGQVTATAGLITNPDKIYVGHHDGTLPMYGNVRVFRSATEPQPPEEPEVNNPPLGQGVLGTIILG